MIQRREFLAKAGAFAAACALTARQFYAAENKLKPMDVGVLIRIGDDPEGPIARVRQLGLNNCFLSLDHHIGKFTPQLAEQIGNALQKYGITATTAEIVGPGRLVWDFEDGPSTIGLVPRASRAARLDALKQTSDFARLLGIPQIQTHCGFIPENPRDPLYDETVLAIREITMHCANNGQHFLMETGQETPTTMARAIMDVNHPNLAVGLDTANLILYGKANPVDAVDIIGPHVRSIHAKDGKWPTDPMKLGEEVLIGTGLVDFEKVFTKLHKLGYVGAVTIEREIEGAQQMEDIRKEKLYLQRIIEKVQSSGAS
ncbi:sugar phosphate isomerase/epimerase family protein [Pseudacidobacterium ailaaui]|uniref:sugar phosphate isomerase/epimerase family protein n=1 Tax=Pseudacidobacterium ailaaui TaxID=1382359 RepID=UPI000A8124D1|nr:sugar phosphate isomerase/epimerase family protein [Pseudacidobacterium ailaaui]